MKIQVMKLMHVAAFGFFSVTFVTGYGVDPFLYSFLFLLAASLNAVALVIGD